MFKLLPSGVGGSMKVCSAYAQCKCGRFTWNSAFSCWFLLKWLLSRHLGCKKETNFIWSSLAMSLLRFHVFCNFSNPPSLHQFRLIFLKLYLNCCENSYKHLNSHILSGVGYSVESSDTHLKVESCFQRINFLQFYFLHKWRLWL